MAGQIMMNRKSVDNTMQELEPILNKVSKLKSDEFGEYRDKFKGSFYEYDVSNVSNKKELMDRIKEYNQENNLQLVVRISGNKLYIGKSYATDIFYFQPSPEVLQSIIDDAVQKGNLSGKGVELYANPNMGILAKLNDGKVERVVPVSGASVDIGFKPGVFSLGKLEKGGWNIPPGSMKEYSDFIKKYSRSFSSSNSPIPESMFNLMGTAKIPFKGTEKLHFRSVIYPGTLHELPLGGEAGITDDIYNQTTHGCLFVGEGRYKILKYNGEPILGNQTELRKKDIGLLIKQGKVQAEDIEVGFKLQTRDGRTATLSLDRYGNQVWLDEEGYYVPFDHINFDWDNPEMPQIVFMPPKYGESEIINKDIQDARLFIDDRVHYEFKTATRVSVAIFPDRYGLLKSYKANNIKQEILAKLEQNEIHLNKDQVNIIGDAVEGSKVNPIHVKINLQYDLAMR